MTVQQGRCLLLVGAYRDNEITGAHPLRPTLEDIERAGATRTRLVLTPLQAQDVHAFIGDALGLAGDEGAPLSGLVYERTQGNPFFLIELLRALHEDQMLWFEAGEGAWRWDTARIRGAGVPDDVVDLMATRLERLRPAGQRALELALALHTEAAEAAYLTMDFEGMEALVRQVFAHARGVLDRVQAAEILIAGHISRGRKIEAIDTAVQTLRLLDVRVPRRPHMAHILAALARVKLALALRPDADLHATAEAEDPRVQAAIRIASSVASTAYVANPNLFPVLVLQQVELSVKHGFTSVTPFAFTLYGTILCGVLGDLDGGYRYGRLGLDLVQRLHVRDVPQRALFTFAATVQHYKEPISETLPRLREAYRISLENGDFEFAGTNAGLYLYHCFHGGYALEPLDVEIAEYEAVVEHLGQSAYLGYIHLYRDTMRTLLDRDEDSAQEREARDHDRLGAMLAAQDGHGAFNHHVLKAQAWLAAGRPTLARPYLQAATYHYGRWGAHARVNQLVTQHGELARALQGDEPSGEPRGTLITSHVTTSSTSRRGSKVDLASVLKASQVLAGEIRLDRLIERMMRIVIENAGAERGVLALDAEQGFRVEGEARADQDDVAVRQGTLLAERADLAQSVVNYVLRTGEVVLLDDALESPQFSRDPHVVAARPRSLLCFPLQHQGRVVGLLYLENSLTSNAFAGRRLEMLKLLAHEIVVSLENARLYEAQQAQTRQLEERVAERTRDLSRANALLAIEKRKSDDLLLNVLPARVAEDLKRTGWSEPESFPDVSVGFGDLVDFTRAAEGLEPRVLIQELNELFTAFDTLIERYGCTRIKTIGDAYMFVCDAPEPAPRHAAQATRAALACVAHVEARNAKAAIRWPIRFGLHSGPVVGGVVGIRKYIYDVFGDTVNTASRMETLSEPMRVNVSATTRAALPPSFRVTQRAPADVKGKGPMDIFFVDGEEEEPA